MPSVTGSALSIPELKLRVLDALGGRLEFCDPDFWPLPVKDQIEAARDRLEADRRKQPAVVRAVLDHERVSDLEELSGRRLVHASDVDESIRFIRLTRSSGGFVFAVRVEVLGRQSGVHRATEAFGLVSTDGQVVVGSQRHGLRLECPICLARGMRISTPRGPVAVQDVGVGTTVWSTDSNGRRIRAAVVRVGRARVPPTHEVVRLRLANGKTAFASPGHPTPDGRLVGELGIGDRLDGSTVVSARLIPYVGRFTYDLLPSGPTGTYFANGVLLGSTLARTTAPAAWPAGRLRVPGPRSGSGP
jgi:hypothetical protein